ncbi:immunity 49 family protein [Streptomyces sp. NPDC004126]|uniref:immunity 49 family protein n=1 Tax=Streptomyces sp. NPDC004126 TaxID=3390695 RepID=UPI003D05481E
MFLDYVNFGMSYDTCDEDASDGPEESVSAGGWIDALCLAVLADRAGRHGEAFRSARRKFAGRAVADPAGELATGLMAVVVERPVQEWPMSAQREARAERRTREALDPADGGAPAAWRLRDVLRDQDMLFKGRAAIADDVTDAQWENLRLASRAGAALFRIALAEPGTVTEVTVAGRTLRYPAERSGEAGAGNWAKAVALALITGEREDLAPLVLAGPAAVRPDTGGFAAYREALHAHLRGADAGPAAERALREAEKAEGSAVPVPPAVLLSQLVDGNEESFNLALADALEAHRDHFQVADRADEPDSAVSLDVLALACHARRRGWDVRVGSPYLPARLLEAAEVR